MKDAKIVHFDVGRAGAHCILPKEKLAELQRKSTMSLGALIDTVGEQRLIGFIVRCNRLQKKLTTKGLSKKIQMSDATVNRIEQGIKSLTKNDLADLEKGLTGLTKQLKSIGFTI